MWIIWFNILRYICLQSSEFPQVFNFFQISWVRNVKKKIFLVLQMYIHFIFITIKIIWKPSFTWDMTSISGMTLPTPVYVLEHSFNITWKKHVWFTYDSQYVIHIFGLTIHKTYVAHFAVYHILTGVNFEWIPGVISMWEI